jgi:cytochrome b
MLQDSRVAIKVWDLPVRLFHWLLVILLVAQVVTGKMGGEMMRWHAYTGYAVLVLVVFRIAWGFLGGTHARFASFMVGPAATLRFARRLFSRQAVPQLGHNPLGGWMVMALVVSLAVQAITGLFSHDGAAAEGPLAARVSFDVSTALSQLHRWNLKLLLVLSAVHVGAVLFHLVVKKEELTVPMFTGVKVVPASLLRERRDASRGTPLRRTASREPSASEFASPWLALALLVASVAVVWAVVR